MSCDTDVKIPALFDPLSPGGQELLKQLGLNASALQDAFNKYAKELSNNLKPLEAKLNDATDIFKKHYQDNVDRAYKWLNETSARGPIAEAYVNKLAQGYAEQARAISDNTVSASQRLLDQAASNRAALDKLIVPGTLSKIGTAADAAQLIDAISRGDTNGFMENLGQMAAMAAAAAVAAAAVAALATAAIGVAPVALTAIAAGAGAFAAGSFGSM